METNRNVINKILACLIFTLVQHDFHIRWFSCRLTVTRRVSDVEQELLTLPEHLNSPRFLVGLCCSIFIFLCRIL
jgi:hypothetical protein